MSAERPPDFHIEDDAARFIAENGGRVYIWLEAFGAGFDTIKTSLDDPALANTTFLCYQPDEGVEVYVDDSIFPPAPEWVLSYHRFPRRHISADFDHKQDSGVHIEGGSGG
jgi:hypothetical protein